jgi:hypothetical protein
MPEFVNIAVHSDTVTLLAKAGGRSSVPLMGIIVKPAMCLVKRELKELMNKKWSARWVAD